MVAGTGDTYRFVVRDAGDDQIGTLRLKVNCIRTD